jgi:oligoendopeptidase F
LFHHYGNRVLSNLVHKITQFEDAPNFTNFQKVEDYVEKVRKMQQDKIKQRNAQQQKLFSQINDLSSGNEQDGQKAAFHSVDGNAPVEGGQNEHDETSEHRKAFGESRKSEGNLKLSDKGSAEQRANLLNQSEGKKDRLREGLEDTNNN